jgi:hypothetical protein
LNKAIMGPRPDNIITVRLVFHPMTKIKNDIPVKIEELYAAGIKPTQIARELSININTLKSHLRKMKLVASLPPKVVVKKTYFSGRIPGIIRRYLEDNPNALDSEVLEGCGLTCSRQYLNKYLNKHGLGRTKAKRNTLLRTDNK